MSVILLLGISCYDYCWETQLYYTNVIGSCLVGIIVDYHDTQIYKAEGGIISFLSA